MPTWESIGQRSAEKSAMVHCGVACGLPMKPGGQMHGGVFGVLAVAGALAVLGMRFSTSK